MVYEFEDLLFLFIQRNKYNTTTDSLIYLRVLSLIVSACFTYFSSTAMNCVFLLLRQYDELGQTRNLYTHFCTSSLKLLNI